MALVFVTPVGECRNWFRGVMTVHSRKAGAMNWRIGTNSCTTMVVLPSMVKASERQRGHVIIACPRTTRLDPDKKSRFWKLSLGHWNIAVLRGIPIILCPMKPQWSWAHRFLIISLSWTKMLNQCSMSSYSTAGTKTLQGLTFPNTLTNGNSLAIFNDIISVLSWWAGHNMTPEVKPSFMMSVYTLHGLILIIMKLL